MRSHQKIHPKKTLKSVWGFSFGILVAKSAYVYYTFDSMYKTDEIGFEKTVAWAIDDLPSSYVDNLKNVAIVIENDPTSLQRTKLHLHRGQTLFGLYEGVPQPDRGNYTMAPPDKITIFKNPIEHFSRDFPSLQAQVRKTVWHEIAHHYGLNHDRIEELENRLPHQKT